jgi:sugar phosphate isomerase/epimerase
MSSSRLSQKKGHDVPAVPELSVSNIAFPENELNRAIALLKELGVDGVEVAPFHAFGRWDVGPAEVAAFRNNLTQQNLRCPALQGIVYHAGAAHLFASEEAREALHRHLVMVARMAGALGAAACVFGAPKLRDPADLPPNEARRIAVDFFKRIGPVFASEGSKLTLEPNARRYGCRFITTTAEAIGLLDEIDTAGVGLQIDTGTFFLEGEDPEILMRAVRYAAHAHLSEPDLAPLGSTGVDHRALADALRRSGYCRSLSIEMRVATDWPDAIRRAVSLARETYLQ